MKTIDNYEISPCCRLDEPGKPQPYTLREALEHVRSTLMLRHIDEVSDEQVEEAIRIADEALAGASE